MSLSHDLGLSVTLQQGQVQVLSRWLGNHSRKGHESVTSTGLTNQTAAQERRRLQRTLERGGQDK